MNRPCLWLCTLAAAAAVAVSDARAFTPHGPTGHGFARLAAGPEPHGPGGGGPPPGAIKQPAPPFGGYSFSGSSFNLSVTRNGHSPTPPPAAAPSGGARPGLLERIFNWW